MDLPDGFAEILAALKTIQQGQQTLIEQITRLTAELQGHRDAASSKVTSFRRLDAGMRLSMTKELLEMILLHVPNHTLLLAQSVSRAFRETILQSSMLQRKLFQSTLLCPASQENVAINPMFLDNSILTRWTMYLDLDESRLAYVDAPKRRAVSGYAVKISGIQHSRDPTVTLRFTAQSTWDWFDKRRLLEPGSWRTMSLSVPACSVVLQVMLADWKQETAVIYWALVEQAESFHRLLDNIASTRLQRTEPRRIDYKSDLDEELHWQL